jgi:hypothetical protein
MQIAKCKVQNEDWRADPHFAICNLHFSFALLTGPHVAPNAMKYTVALAQILVEGGRPAE